jgi:uncharacterized protein YcgI (DUF1989 family)
MTVSRTDAESVPGKVVWDRVIPKMEYQGLKIKTGQVVRVIDLEGEQDMDTVTLNAHDPSEHVSMPWSTSAERPDGAEASAR